MWTALMVLALQAQPVPAASPADPWSAVQFMVGDWEGESEGEPGKGTVKRTYRFVLGGKFLHEQNVSTYPPQPKNPKGEVHEHWSFISYDKARRALVLRQFHQEGFVNQYALVPAAAGRTLVFESEGFENIPAGFKARETYEVVSPNEFIETFELSAGGKPFEVYSRNRFRRAARAPVAGTRLHPSGPTGMPLAPRFECAAKRAWRIPPGDPGGFIMHFYALRVACETCGSSFVVGGSAEHDLTLWRDSLVECRYCGTRMPAALGEMVPLGSALATPESPGRTPCHA